MAYKFDPIEGKMTFVVKGDKGDTGDVGPAGTSFIWLGDYSGSTSYVVNDVVYYNGSAYICILASTGNSPTNTTYWSILAAKGADGTGTGDVVGPASSTDGHVVLFDGTDGKLIKDSGLSVDDIGGGIKWYTITTSQTAEVDKGYVANGSSLITLTLPATAAANTVIRLAGYGVGGWKIAQNSGQYIIFGNMLTTAGTGYLASTNQYDAIELVCVIQDTIWLVVGSVGNIEII